MNRAQRRRQDAWERSAKGKAAKKQNMRNMAKFMMMQERLRKSAEKNEADEVSALSQNPA